MLEYNALSVELAEHSDKSCFFRILPRFKVRSEGDPVRAHDQILLVSERANGQYLGQSSKRFSSAEGTAMLEHNMDDDLFEACVSAQSFPWFISRFSAPTLKEKTANQTLYVRGGDLIQIYDKEKEGYVAADNLHKLQSLQTGKPGDEKVEDMV